ncbi:hypothetical protein WK66_06450 [Burkholderia ubonensis]|nr:hypothetical protein WK66_06450 [Burkholderia ubonensis]
MSRLFGARNLETTLHRFGQFFHILLDDFFVESKCDGLVAQVLLRSNPAVGPIGALGQELMLKHRDPAADRYARHDRGDRRRHRFRRS